MSMPIMLLTLFIGVPLAIFLIAIVAYLGIKTAGGLFTAIAWVCTHCWRFVAGVLGDSVRFVGALLAVIAFVPLTVLNVVIGRWSAAAHFGRAVQAEFFTAGQCLYRVAVGHPLRFLLLGGVTEGIEKRLPAAVAAAPGSDKPSKRTGQFDGYTIVGSLKGGGSGGRLYVAEPDEAKQNQLRRAGAGNIDQVVIKAFSVHDGSSMPQIVRESRALEAARKLGLVLEHELTDERFFYVMRYVPGDTLGVVAERLHAEAGPGGLRAPQLSTALGYVCDLLNTLEVYHRGGLWHKDIKPDNIIVHGGKAHLVDLGLVTPLRSAMTLTTHGTEYFRDPEMVRLALRGAKVHEVDGVKFDVYGAGAVLYAVIENSFPAHGGLSQLKTKCPEALRWIVRRAMAETQQRYATAAEMLADLQVVQRATDPFSLKPKDLPSVAGNPGAGVELESDPMVMNPGVAAAAAGSPMPASFANRPPEGGWHDRSRDGGAAAQAPAGVGAAAAAVGVAAKAAPAATGPAVVVNRSGRPRLSVTNWWTGKYRYSVSKQHEQAAPEAPAHGRHGPARRIHAEVPAELHPHAGTRAKDQLRRARARAAQTQKRANQRMNRHATRYSNKPNAGVWFAGLLLIATVAGVIIIGTNTSIAPSPNDASGANSSIGAYTIRLFSDDLTPNDAMTTGWHAIPMPADETYDTPLAPEAAAKLNGEGVLIVDSAPRADLSAIAFEQLGRLGARLDREGLPVVYANNPPADADRIQTAAAESILNLDTTATDLEAARSWAREFLMESPEFAGIVWRNRPMGGSDEAYVHLLGESDNVTEAMRHILETTATHDAEAGPAAANERAAADHLVRIHYHRPDGDYQDWNIWAWTPGHEGEPMTFTTTTEYGRFAEFARTTGADRQFFIVRKGDWEAKDWAGDRSVAFDADGLTEAWLIAGDPRIFRDARAAEIAAAAYAGTR